MQSKVMTGMADLGTKLGKLTEEKNIAYGDSFRRSGAFLSMLYPNGIRPDQYDDALTLVRIFDKLMRIATDQDAFGESPYNDIVGYGLLGSVLHTEKTEKTPTLSVLVTQCRHYKAYNNCTQACCLSRVDACTCANLVVDSIIKE